MPRNNLALLNTTPRPETVKMAPPLATSKAAGILSAITPVLGQRRDDDREYRFTDPDTERQFEIRRSGDASDGHRFFLAEFQPSGRIVLMCDDRVIDGYDEPRIAALSAQHGPNGLMAALRAVGVPVQSMVRFGGGYGIGTIFYPSLQDCAQAIADSLTANTWYQHFRQETEQERIARERQDAQSSHQYWTREKAAQESAGKAAGIFKGLRNMQGPLPDALKKRILSYLAQPDQKTWLDIRGLAVTGHGTLWQAWCHADASAPRSGDVGYPSKDTLLRALKEAVSARRQEIDRRLADSTPTGLRRVK